MKTIATGILTAIFVGLVTTFSTMFSDISNLKAEDHIQGAALIRIEKRQERMENKIDRLLEDR